jgi:hypothetical protein
MSKCRMTIRFVLLDAQSCLPRTFRHRTDCSYGDKRRNFSDTKSWAALELDLIFQHVLRVPRVLASVRHAST